MSKHESSVYLPEDKIPEPTPQYDLPITLESIDNF